MLHCQLLMFATNQLWSSLTNLLWLFAANLPGYRVAFQHGFRLLEVYVFFFAAALGAHKALVVDDRLLPSLRHRAALGSGDVVAVLALHHLRLLALNNLAILYRSLYAMLAWGRHFLHVDRNRFAIWVIAPRLRMLGRSYDAFLRWAFLALVVVVAVAWHTLLLIHRGADVAGAAQFLLGDHRWWPWHLGAFLPVRCAAFLDGDILHHSVLNIDTS